jgi:hypothetical protein
MSLCSQLGTLDVLVTKQEWEKDMKKEKDNFEGLMWPWACNKVNQTGIIRKTML